MEFSVDRNELAVAVTHAVHGIPNNPFQPVRAGMLIRTQDQRVTFAGSDGDVTFTALSDCVVYSMDEEVIVPGKLFADIVKTLPDQEVFFKTGNDRAYITCGKGEFKFPIYKTEYPSLPEPAGIEGGMDAEEFTSAVKKVSPACVRTDTSPVLSAIYLDPDDHDVFMVATDRFRLAVVRCSWSPAGMPGPTLMPSWAAERFARSAQGTVTLGWDDRVLTMASGSLTVTCRALQGEFPNWRKLLPPEPCNVSVDPGELLGALKRAALAIMPTDPVKLTFTGGKLRVEAGQENHAEDIIDTDYKGEEFTALFGIGMLTDGLLGCDDICRFGWTGSKVFLSCGDYTYTMQPRKSA